METKGYVNTRFWSTGAECLSQFYNSLLQFLLCISSDAFLVRLKCTKFNFDIGCAQISLEKFTILPDFQLFQNSSFATGHWNQVRGIPGILTPEICTFWSLLKVNLTILGHTHRRTNPNMCRAQRQYLTFLQRSYRADVKL